MVHKGLSASVCLVYTPATLSSQSVASLCRAVYSFWVRSVNGFPANLAWFLVGSAATQLATQLHQRRIQVARSNKVARKRLTESNGTPAMDLGHFNVVLK